MHTRSKDLAAWLRDRVSGAGARGLLVSLTGRADSAVVARLCQMAMPEQVLGVIQRCHDVSSDDANARLVAGHYDIPTVELDLRPSYDRMAADLSASLAQLPLRHAPAASGNDRERQLATVNVKPRLRMTALYFLANSLSYLVAGTATRSELTIGGFTKYGDGGVDLLPLGALLRSDVLAIALDLGVPPSLIEKERDAKLGAGQRDDGEMGFTYAELERYLADGPEAVPPALALRIERLMRQSEHKRKAIPTPGSEPRTAEI